MTNWNDYKREESPRLTPGDYRVEIVDVEETVSKTSGNPMLVVTVQPNGSNIKIKNYLVKNDYFNRNATDLFDAFNIEENNFDLLTWPGAVGAAHLKEDESGYLKVGYFINKKKAEALPEWVGTRPERQTLTELAFTDYDGDFGFPADDELPE